MKNPGLSPFEDHNYTLLILLLLYIIVPTLLITLGRVNGLQGTYYDI